MKESFIFYKSFYESIKEVDDNIQLELFKALCEYSINGKEIELTPIAKALFILMKPNIDSANKRYIASVENGKKGGRPKKNKNLEKPRKNLEETQTEPTQNLNDDVDVDDNVDVNDNIYNYIYENFGITINGTNLLNLQKWEEIFANDVLKYGVDLCVKNGVRTFSYLLAIYNNWKNSNYTTLEQIQKREKKEPEWFDKTIKKEEISDKEKLKELGDFFNCF